MPIITLRIDEDLLNEIEKLDTFLNSFIYTLKKNKKKKN